MKLSASQTDQFLSWATRNRIPPEDFERIRQMLASNQREVDLSVVAIRAVPFFVRAERMLTSLTVRLTGDECVLNTAQLPQLCTLRIVDGGMRSLRIEGAESLRLCPASVCSLEVGHGETLHEIQLHSTAFDRLSVRDLSQLSTLDVSGSTLKQIEVLRAPRLTRLDASMTPLSGDGFQLDCVAALTTVNLARESLARIPAALRRAPALRELNLSGNLLMAVPPHELPSGLLSLDLSENKLVDVPLGKAFQSTLRDLRVGMNEIVCLADTIGAFRRLEVLDLRNNRLLVLSPAIGRCSLLRVLKLSSNRLSWLPDEICGLVSLERLEIDANMLLALPSDMHSLTRLESLQVQHNMLGSLPERLDEVPLRRLNLRGNPLFLIPDPLLRRHTLTGRPAFKCLAGLDLGNTRLAEIPAGLGDRCTLVQLRLDGNEQLSGLPDDFENLRQLRWLDLRRCGFRQLPAVLKEMSLRTDVLLHCNPLDQRVRLNMREGGSVFDRGAWAAARQPLNRLSISDEVRLWRGLVQADMTPKQEACWSAQAPFRHSHAFARLIAGLRDSPEIRPNGSATRTDFWLAVNRLLVDMEDNPELVDDMLEAAAMTGATLADRYSQSLDRLALAARLHVLSKGDSSAQGRVAAGLMRESFRRECIAAKAAQGGCEQRVDFEVALDLAYRSHLAHRRGSALRGGAVGYLRVSGACGAQLSEEIQDAEARDLVDYMVGSTVWRRFLIRWRYSDYLEVIGRFDASLEPGPSEDPRSASVTGTVCEPTVTWDRDILFAQRDAAVHAWLLRETVELLNDNPSTHEASQESS